MKHLKEFSKTINEQKGEDVLYEEVHSMLSDYIRKYKQKGMSDDEIKITLSSAVRDALIAQEIE